MSNHYRPVGGLSTQRPAILSPSIPTAAVCIRVQQVNVASRLHALRREALTLQTPQPRVPTCRELRAGQRARCAPRKGTAMVTSVAAGQTWDPAAYERNAR